MNTLNPLPRPEAEKVIAATVAILDRYTKLYSQLSSGRFPDYASYMASDGFADEDEFIKPKLFTDFLEQVLGFGRDEYSPEHATAPGVPDFQPVDVLPHPFYFEVKGSDSHDLTTHLPQVRKYLKPPFDFGVLSNMRDILAYDLAGVEMGTPVIRVSLLELYRATKTQPGRVLDFPNTRQFLEFVSLFHRQKLDRPDKIERIKHAKDLALLPKVDPDELVATIRKVVLILTADARDFKLDLEAELKLPVARHERLSVVAELVGIARELDRGYSRDADTDPARFISAREGTTEHRAFDVYLNRVAYFTMVRILLARIWEDVGFIESQLYNGGFAKWYKMLEGKIRDVLRHAFGYAADRYDWLYRKRNNYSWYQSPSENAVIDVLYEFARHNLGTLDTDVLGTVYEQFVERVDRKNKGQYYTPREVISFIWDRVGFIDDDAYFNFKDGRRTPKMILDVATGSGGFLVEAAHRIRERSKCDRESFNDLLEIMMGVTQGLCGCEISLFAHHITEVNLLIQLTPVIRDILKVKPEVPNVISTLGLSTVPGNSLGLVSHDTLFTNNHTVSDRPRELAPRDPKDPVRQNIIEFSQFDFVCSNPPYVGEKGHKELFRGTLAEYPYWERHYQGKMDYLYWFIILGLLKLKEGGKLGFITTSYWPTADGASHLRRFILEKALIHEIIDFGETRMFEGAPGQHNMVFVLERCSDATASAGHTDGCPSPANVERKRRHRIKIVKVKKVPPAKPGDKSPPMARAVAHVSRHIDKARHSDDCVDVFMSAIPQGELNEGPWPLFVHRGDDRILGKVQSAGLPFKQSWTIDQGVVPSPLRLTRAKLSKLPTETIQKYRLKVGDGVFVLSVSEMESAGLTADDRRIMKPYFKNSAIDAYVTSQDTDEYLVYTGPETVLDEYPGVMRHLTKFKLLLQARLADYDESYEWYELHRSRAPRLFEGDKVVCSYRAEDPAFAFHHGSFYGSTDMYFIKPRDEREKHSLKYLVGILNSKVTRFWLENKGKSKGTATELFSTPVENLSIRRIDFEDKRDAAMHDRMVSLVDEMIATKQKLVGLNRYFAARLTRLSGPDELPAPDVEAVTRSLKGAALRRVHNHPKVKVRPTPESTFVLARVGEVADAAELFGEPSEEHMYALRLGGKEKQAMTIFGPKEVLTYLKGVLPNWKGKSWDEIRDIPVARDLAAYQSKEKEVVSSARKLLSRVAALQSRIDALACKLYGLTDEEVATMRASTG